MNLMDKSELLAEVRKSLVARQEAARKEMEAAQDSANQEQKSTMGDKYETGRAMAQIDRDMYARQYAEISRELAVLDRIGSMGDMSSRAVVLGSLADTSLGLVFIAVSLGVVVLGDKRVTVVSLKSPLGQALVGKEAGAVFTAQGKPHRLHSVN